jgi:hypothetical protein
MASHASVAVSAVAANRTRAASPTSTVDDRWERLRPIPYVRPIRTTLRTAHLAAFAVLYGGHWHGVAAAQLVPALVATVATGGALVALEMYRTPAWPLQTRGIATLVKVVLVAAVAVAWQARLSLLTAALVIGGVTSHMPGRFRYYSLLHGRVIGSSERG